MKARDSMKAGEILETIAILVALASLIPLVFGDMQRSYIYYLFFMLCLLVYVTYRRVKRLRAALKSSKKRGSGPRVPPFFQ